MRKHRFIFAVLAIVLAFSMVSMLTGCGGGTGGTKKAPKSAVTIGIINPQTGPLAGFGEGEDWIDQQILDYVNNTMGGINFADYGVKLPLKIVVYDSQSDTTQCTQLAQKLIQQDTVDMVVVRHTPDTVNPVTAICERYQEPCVAFDAPVDAWLAAAPDGGYQWTYHSWWTLDQMYDQYKALWTQAGFAPSADVKIGTLFSNDADGTAWAGIFNPNIQSDGYTLVDPGTYPDGTQDFSSIIQQFMTAGVTIVCGTNTNPDFATFWRQCRQLGFQPKFVTMGKAYLLQSDADAIGADLMDGLCGETWWDPGYPFKSSLTGLTPADLAQKYQTASNRQITQPMGDKYASLEIAVDALSRAGSLDKTAIRDAIGATNLDTIFGHIQFNDKHYCETKLAGGQWQVDAQGNLHLYVVNNSLHTDLPTTGTLKPLTYK